MIRLEAAVVGPWACLHRATGAVHEYPTIDAVKPFFFAL